MKVSKDGSPLDCRACEERDRDARNCRNRLGLSEAARGVYEYTDGIKEELKRKNAQKVMSLGGLRFYECPLSYISMDTREVMRVCFLMDGANVLYFGGGWGDQPAWLVEAFEVFKAETGNVSRRNEG